MPFRTLITDFELALKHWNSVLPLVIIALNEAGLLWLGSSADGAVSGQLKVMTGISPSRPLQRLFLYQPLSIKDCSIDRARATKLITINRLQQYPDTMHKNISHSVSQRRPKATEAHN